MLKIRNKLCWALWTVSFALLFSACSKPEAGRHFGTTEWFDDFLFCKYEPVIMEHTLCFDYNEDAVRLLDKPTRFALYEKDGDGYKAVNATEAKLYKNGELCKDNIFETTVKDSEFKIGIEFTSQSAEGTHKYYLKVIDNGGLDRVNDVAAEEDSSPLIEEWRAKKMVVTNPLVLGLRWFFAILLACLAIWLLLLKYIFFPPIKVASVMISDPYYSKLNVKGKRMVVFTNKRQEQPFLSKIFTGEILYNVNPVWTTPLVIEAGKGRKLMVRRNKDYVFDPYGSMLASHADYVVENMQTNEKIKMSVN